MTFSVLVYPEYYGLPQPVTLILVYTFAVISVLIFLIGLRGEVRPYGSGLWVFIVKLLKGYRGWPGYVYDVLLHRRLFGVRGRHGIGHLLMFYGLLLSFIGTILVALNQYLGIMFEYRPYSGQLFLDYSLVMDLTSWVLFVGSFLAISSFLLRVKNYTKKEATGYLVYPAGFMFLSVSGALIEDYRVYALGLVKYIAYFPNAGLLGNIHLASQVYIALYYAHFLTAFALIAAIPYTGVAHSYLSLLNYSTRERKSGELSKPFDLKTVMQSGNYEVKVGAKSYRDLDWIGALNPLACVGCNRCEEVCPANAAGRELSPTRFAIKLKREISGRSEELLQLISEEEVWGCTTCGACMEACPVYVRHVDYIIDFRRRLTFDMKLDAKKSGLLMNLNQYGNSLGLQNQGRNSWITEEFGVPRASESSGFKYLLWVGCMGSFDGKARESVRSFLEILRESGEIGEYAILGDEETDCGDPARRLGEESLFQNFALSNIEIFKKYNVKNIVVMCPHGYNTFKNEYKDVDEWMKGVNVYHYVEVIERLVREGKVRIKGSGEKVTIHDPCYLARHNSVVEPQRYLLGSVAKVVEPERSGKNTFCCGAGGANYWYEVKENRRISHIRAEQLYRTGARKAITLCPFCNAMLSDASTVALNGQLEVIDIATFLTRGMERASRTKNQGGAP